MLDWDDAEGPLRIRYHFEMAAGRRLDLALELDRRTLRNLAPLPAGLPTWTRLEFQQCPGCPLDAATEPDCPAAARLAHLVTGFSAVASHEPARVRVELPEREVVKDTTVQVGLSSFFGAHLVTSGCPVLGELRPLVRFHLPFATVPETMVRAVSLYLLRQYLREAKGQPVDWSLRGLAEVYRAIAEVNAAFAQRIRSAVTQDASLNAIVRLDLFAKVLPNLVEGRLDQLRTLLGEEG